MWMTIPAALAAVWLAGSPAQVLDSVALAELAADQEATVEEQVDINVASEEDLQKVPGIGPATAKRIVEWRRDHGPFQSLDDLLNIRGIGVKSLEKLRPYLKVSPADGQERNPATVEV